MMSDVQGLAGSYLIRKADPDERFEDFDCGDPNLNAIPFYEKNGFRMLNDKEIDESALTRPMFFDLGDIM